MKLPYIIGHRGAKGIAPENSLSGFRKAVELGIDGVELDIHLTKDGKLAVIHDMDLRRLNGSNLLVKELTFKELRQYDVSKFFVKEQEYILKKLPEEKRYFIELKIINDNLFYLNILEQISRKKITFYLRWDGKQFDIVKRLLLFKDEGKKIGFKQLKIKKREILELEKGRIKKYTNEHPPLLNEALKALKGNLFVNIEIKGGETIYPGIIDRVVEETEFFGHENILFSCFDRKTGILLKEKYPTLKVNGLYSTLINPKKYINGLDGLNPKCSLATKKLITYSHQLNKTIYVWTIDNDIDMIRFILCGVDGIITNYPQILKKISKTIQSLLENTLQ